MKVLLGEDETTQTTHPLGQRQPQRRRNEGDDPVQVTPKCRWCCGPMRCCSRWCPWVKPRMDQRTRTQLPSGRIPSTKRRPKRERQSHSSPQNDRIGSSCHSG
jgi:hypothetical protein